MKKIFFAFVFVLLIALQLNRYVYAAPFGNFLELSGGYVKTTSSSMNFPSSFDFSAWIRPTSVDGIQKILSIGEKSGNKLHYEVGINGGSLSLRFHHGSFSQTLITAGHIDPSVWTNIGVSISSQNIKLYINGSAVITTSGVNDLLPIGDTIVLGGSFTEPSSNTEGFQGAIDDVRIPNEGIFIATYPPPPAASFLFWNLDETRGEWIAHDGSLNHLDGTLIGGDSKIHFFGILPTPTPFSSFALPTIRWNRPILPTLGFPYLNPTSGSQPTPTQTQQANPSPTSSIRDNRPVLPR